jgi:hypothetical protein
MITGAWIAARHDKTRFKKTAAGQRPDARLCGGLLARSNLGPARGREDILRPLRLTRTSDEQTIVVLAQLLFALALFAAPSFAADDETLKKDLTAVIALQELPCGEVVNVIVRVGKVLENSTDYSIQNTLRQALFLPTTREAKYKAKAAIDTFFTRAGDVVSARVRRPRSAHRADDIRVCGYQCSVDDCVGMGGGADRA